VPWRRSSCGIALDLREQQLGDLHGLCWSAIAPLGVREQVWRSEDNVVVCLWNRWWPRRLDNQEVAARDTDLKPPFSKLGPKRVSTMKGKA
jgi:hypothetical protein